MGGLGTPFLLYDDSRSLGELVLYNCLILTGMAAVYFYKGWPSLLIVSSTGGWLVFLFSYLGSLPLTTALSPGERIALQLGVIFAWLLLWITPVAREISHGSNRILAHAYTASAPIIALEFTSMIWELSNAGLAWITLPAAILYALAALVLRRFGEVGLSRTHALVGLLFLTLILVLVLMGTRCSSSWRPRPPSFITWRRGTPTGPSPSGRICCPASPGSGSPPASSPIPWTLLTRLARRSSTYPPSST